MRPEPADMPTSELVAEIAAHINRSMRGEETRDDWERHRAVSDELNRRIPR